MLPRLNDEIKVVIEAISIYHLPNFYNLLEAGLLG